MRYHIGGRVTRKDKEKIFYRRVFRDVGSPPYPMSGKVRITLVRHA